MEPAVCGGRAVGRHAFGNPDLGVWLAKLGMVDGELGRGERRRWDGTAYDKRAVSNTTVLWREMNTQFLEKWGEGDSTAWREIADRLHALSTSVPTNIPSLLERECRHSLEIARWTCDRAILRRGDVTMPARKVLAGRFAEHVTEYRKLWLERSRYGGLEDSCGGYWHFASQA